MRKVKKRIYYILFVILVSFNLSSHDKEFQTGVTSLNNFKRIVILEMGRKKPLDTFAQNILKLFSGRSEFKKKAAIYWLARVLLNPESTLNDEVFLITNPEVLNSIGVVQTGKDRDRYSFFKLQEHLVKLRSLAISVSRIKEDERTSVENEIILLYNKLYQYRQLTAGLQFAFPSSGFSIKDTETRKYLRLTEAGDNFSFIEIVEQKDKIKDLLSKLQNKKKEDWTSVEKNIFNLNRKIKELSNYFQNLPLNIIPVVRDNDEKWINPWDLLFINYAHNTPIKKEIYLISDFIDAYRNGNQEKFDTAIKSFNKLIIEQSKDLESNKKIAVEILYNKIDPFYKSKFFYGFSLLFLMLSFIILKNWLYKFSFLLLLTGLITHSSGIIMRMIILGRPPVTNLYETFVFTAWITVLLGIILELIKKKNIGILTGSISGIILLLIAGRYAIEGDTMGMLVAVLNTNFWLAVHIITIAVGYAGIVISGVIGHVYVFQIIFKPDKKDLLKNTYQAIFSTQAIGLIFVFLGTVLGGMWADQSWGRFWGWDPKENGALLIILWSAVLFHARLVKWIKELGLAYGSICGIITIVLTWFGINLLGVGLHSYGFTSGLVITLTIFVAFELFFILGTYYFIKLRKKILE